MEKVLLFPGPRLIMHNCFLTVLPMGGAVALFLDRRPLAALCLVVLAVFFLRDVGFVVVQLGRLRSYRIFRLPRTAEVPAVLACDVDMIKRQVLRFVPTQKYWYPVLTLDNGKSIRLPIATKSRDKAVHTASLLRKA